MNDPPHNIRVAPEEDGCTTFLFRYLNFLGWFFVGGRRYVKYLYYLGKLVGYFLEVIFLFNGNGLKVNYGYSYLSFELVLFWNVVVKRPRYLDRGVWLLVLLSLISGV